MIEFRYILFHLLLAIILIYYGKQISCKSINSYWKLSLIPILAFTIEEGLRWGRNIDWCVYYYVYNDYLQGFSSNHEILFQAIWKLYAFLNLPYPIIIASCSCLLIFAIFYFAKTYKSVSYILIPFIVFNCAGTATNLIRWYMGFSFLLIAIRLYQEEKRTLAILLTTCSVCTHIGLIIAVPIFYVLLTYNKILFKPFAAIVISILLSVLFDPSIMGKFSSIFDFFKGFDRFDTYANDATGWLTGEGQNADSERRSTSALLIANIPLWVYILVGYKICQNLNLIKAYNLMLVGIYLKNTASGLELMGRFAYLFEPFICVMASYGIWHLMRQKRTFANTILLFISIIYILRKLYVFCAPMEYEELMHYVWDYQLSPSSLINLYTL